MSIENPSSASGPRVAPSLDEFRKAAEQHDAISLTLDGERWQVKGTGILPGSGRQVAWVSPENARIDTTSAFTQALEQSFSAGISRAVARELDLQPRPGQPLSSRAVTQAIDMAKTGQQALAGVDFFTRLQFSAVQGGPEFKRVCAEEGHAAGKLSQADLQHLDHLLDQHFQQATSNGASPVTYHEAERWLKEALRSLG
ncbi:MAG: hypothetical protein WBC18_06265 [Ottowia sp.]|uniref:hypothetical protein n=1 Tax=unclassified Ottowia TaxID=2645081 RepID=UPI003C2C13D8